MIEQMDGQVSLFDQDSWSGRMCREHSAPTTEKTSPQSSKKRSGSSSRKPPLFLYLKKDGPQADASWEPDGALLGEFSTHSFGECPRDGVESHLSQILEANPHRKYYLSAKACQGILNREARRGKDLPEALKAVLLMQSESGGGCDGGGKGALVQTEVSGTLGCNNDQTIFCLNDQGGSVMGISENVSGTLRAQEHGHQPLVTVFDPAQITSPVNRSRPEPGKPCHTLTSRMGTGGGNVPIMFRQQRFGSYDLDNVAGTCKARDGKDGTTNLVCAVDCRHGTENPDTNGTLQAKSTGGQSLNLNNVVREVMTVRRLTPMECERLQGFPDGWTDIGEWVDSKGKTRKTTDSARYKALGNSIALPPWKWVLKRLCAQYERDATMASLFDGIGGFPLIWEQLNGKGSCLWASEIEEFPMAVTRKHFG
nr:MAG TPA: Cytosine specific methyltransferase [Caudoviricetes sp.]